MSRDLQNGSGTDENPPTKLALLCAGGECGLFAFLEMPIPSTPDELASALMPFGWFLSQGSAEGIEGKIYSPLCSKCATKHVRAKG